MFSNAALRISVVGGSGLPRRLRSKISPDDLTQSAWLKIIERERRRIAEGLPPPTQEGRHEGEVRNYFRRALDWVTRDEIKARGRAIRDAGVERALPEVGENVAADFSTPSRKLMREERAELVRRAVASLPDGLRDAVRLHTMEGKTINETAALLGVTVPQASHRIRKGVEILAFRLKELKDV